MVNQVSMNKIEYPQQLNVVRTKEEVSQKLKVFSPTEKPNSGVKKDVSGPSNGDDKNMENETKYIGNERVSKPTIKEEQRSHESSIKMSRSYSPGVSISSEFDDETRSSETDHDKPSTPLVYHDAETSPIDVKNETREEKMNGHSGSQQSGGSQQGRYPVYEVNIYQGSQPSGLGTEDSYQGSSIESTSCDYQTNKTHTNRLVLTNINDKEEEPEVNSWASPRLYNFFFKSGMQNKSCADCGEPLKHPHTIYASFYINPFLVRNRLTEKIVMGNNERRENRVVSRRGSICNLLDQSDSDDVSCVYDNITTPRTHPKEYKGMKSQGSISTVKHSNKEKTTQGLTPPKKSEGRTSTFNSLNQRKKNQIPLGRKGKEIKKKDGNQSSKDVICFPDFESIHTCFGSSVCGSADRNGISNVRSRKKFVQPHGVFVCKDCMVAHKLLGREITTVKSVFVTTLWEEEEIKIMETSGGNKWARGILGCTIPLHREQLTALSGSSTLESRLIYARAKYEIMAFLFPISQSHPRPQPRWDDLLYNAFSKRTSQPKTTEECLRLPDRLIDYFCVVGASRGVKGHSGLLSQGMRLHKLELQPKIWDCFPLSKNSHSDMPIPPCLNEYAFPNGCRPSTQKRSPKFFTFIMRMDETNAKIYGSALLVYEDITNSKQIIDCLPNQCKPGNDEQENPNEKADNEISPNVKMYLPKVLIILSHYPFVNLHRAFLTQVYLLAHTKSTPIPIERYIGNFCAEIPLPPQGQISYKFGYFGEEENLNVKFSRPAKNQLPHVGFSFRPLFTSLSVSNILVVFACLAQELSVVLCSRYTGLLTPVAEAIHSLLFPFVWQGIYIPLLPNSRLDILQASVPIFVGIHTKYYMEMQKKGRSNGIVFVDLDRDIVNLGFEKYNMTGVERRTPVLPEKETEKLKSKLEKFGGIAYLPPQGGHKGRVTTGWGLETIVNAEREIYAHQKTMVPKQARAMGNFKKDKPPLAESISQARSDILAKVDEAYLNDEYTQQIYFPSDTLGMGAKFCSRDKIRGKNSSSNVLKKRNDDDESEKKEMCNSLLDDRFDEMNGFSSKEIREGFLRFFAVLLRNYERCISDVQTKNSDEPSDEIFARSVFLEKSGNTSSCAKKFLSKLISTRMFESFVQERSENPNRAEFLLFDETIIVRKNMSRKNNRKVGLKKTPFLNDTSTHDLEERKAPSPSISELPDRGAGYFKQKFPRLRSELYGPSRAVQQFPSETYQRRNEFSYRCNNNILSKLYLSSPYSNYLPDRDIIWSLYALAYRRDFSFNKQVLMKHDGKADKDKKERRKAFFKQCFDASVLSALSTDVAKDILKEKRTKGTDILFHIARVQAKQRMLRDRKNYLRAKYIIVYVQTELRKKLFRMKYGSTFKGSHAMATRIQKVFRGHIGRNLCEAMKVASSSIQHFGKGVIARMHFLKLRSGCKLLSRLFKGQQDKILYALVRESVVTIQAYIRSWLKRQFISRKRKERIISYRIQIFELWRRTATPLSYRSKFWLLFRKNSFLNLALHEDELKRLWELLGEPINTDTSVVKNCKTIQRKLDDNRGKENELIPLFPAEAHRLSDDNVDGQRRKKLQESKIKLSAERQKMYSILKTSEQGTKNEIFQLFNLEQSEEKKKERIVKCLWEHYHLVKPSMKFVLDIYKEYGNLHNAIYSKKNKREVPPSSILKRFGIEVSQRAINLNAKFGNKANSEMLLAADTVKIVKSPSQNLGPQVQSALDERIQWNLMDMTLASLEALKMEHLRKTSQCHHDRKKEIKEQCIRRFQKMHLQFLANRAPGRSWNEKRRHLLQNYLMKTEPISNPSSNFMKERRDISYRNRRDRSLSRRRGRSLSSSSITARNSSSSISARNRIKRGDSSSSGRKNRNRSASSTSSRRKKDASHSESSSSRRKKVKSSSKSSPKRKKQI